MCGDCCVFILPGSMSNHRKVCCGKKNSIDVRLLANPSDETSEDFKVNVIATLRNDTVGILCKTDRTILLCGYWSYQKVKKSNNKIGARDAVRKDMRYLAHCYTHFLNSTPEITYYKNSKDMFLIKNFITLKKAIDKYCLEGDELKAGLKHGLQYALISAAKTLRALAYTQGNDLEAKQIEKFQSVFKMWEDTIFGDATLKLQFTVDKKAKKPCELPVEKDLAKLRDFLSSTIEESIQKPTKASYILLRNATCARLTLFNARRGGEPARLFLSDLEEGLNDSWLPTHQQSNLDNLDDLEKSLLDSLKVTYFVGKRNRLVPLILPKDSIKALKHLADSWCRKEAGIAEDNTYVFASTNNSDRHLSGWHALNGFCVKLNLSSASKITATKNRHRMSTMYAMMDMTDSEKQSFYNHMGHSQHTNEQRYQCPPSVKELTTVGKFCSIIDNGK